MQSLEESGQISFSFKQGTKMMQMAIKKTEKSIVCQVAKVKTLFFFQLQPFQVLP